MSLLKTQTYSPLNQEEHEYVVPSTASRRRPPLFIILLTTHLVVLLGGIATTRLAMNMGLLSNSGDPSIRLSGEVYAKIPARLRDFSEETQRNGSFDFPSIYRGYSPEVDQAWDDLDVGLLDIEVTFQDIEKLGYDPSTMAHWPADVGGSYMVTFESSHLLHCVDYLRKVTYWHYDYYMERQDDESFLHPKQMERHADHCLEMLRQTLMCNADTTLLFFRWVEERDEPWPDFNTIHQCRNFESLLTWGKKHQRVNQVVPMKPPGADYLIKPP